MNPINASIRLKLTASFLILGLAIIVTVTISSYIHMRNTLFDQVEHQGTAVTKTFAQLTTAHIFKSDFAAVFENAREIVTTGNLGSVTLMDTQGDIWVTTKSDQRVKGHINAFYRSVMATRSIGHQKQIIDGEPVLEFVSPIIALGDVVYLLITEIPLRTIDEQIAVNTRRIIAITLFTVLASVFLAVILSNLLTVPIQRLVEGTDEISKGNLDYKIEVTSRDEVGELTEAFNRMAANLRSGQIEKKVMEKRLVQSQKLESLGTLASGIAHDFNNILYPIMGFTEMALDEVSKNPPARQYMREVLNSAERAKTLVAQILSFSRTYIEDYQPVVLQPILMDALKLARATIPTTIRIETHFAVENGTVRGAENQLHQVIMNLVTNAFRAMESSGGVLKLKLEETVLSADEIPGGQVVKPGSFIVLSVQDSGHGMPAAVVERIFEPYYTTWQKGSGTGLGLSITHGIIQSHGGFINVESTPDSGTTFTVFLPRIESTTTVRQTEEPDDDIPVGNENILLVDDEEQVIKLARKMLHKLGYNVHARTSSVEALSLFRSKPEAYDLVITDMTMPHMTGIDLTRALLDIRPDMRIILCTGFSAMIDEKKAKALGIRAFVMKPIMKRKMARTVRQVLDSGDFTV